MTQFRTGRAIGRLVIASAIAVASVIAQPGSVALAAPPGNDAMADAVVITSLPFVETVDLAEATFEANEPSNCGATTQTVWYRFTPTTTVKLTAQATGGTATSAYLEFSPGFLVGLGCSAAPNPVSFTAFAGSTYLVQVGTLVGGGAPTEVTIAPFPAPDNDHFADATPLSAVPYTDTVDTTSATTEPAEPAGSCSGFLTTSVWYAFTPTIGATYSTRASGMFPADVDVYTGTTLGNLTRIACGGFGNPASWAATAGTTYYLQMGSSFGTGPLTISIDVAPPPSASFGWGPPTPSVFDTVQFNDGSFDPANVGIQTRSWDFGDGTTGDGFAPTHRYAADGDYAVTLTVTTVDGRTGSTTNTVSVRTHDVRIAGFQVPNTSRAGRSSTITVSIANARYPETVHVQLMRSVPGGFEVVADSTQAVPVVRKDKTVDYRFTYPVTPGDAALGRITFKAVASIVGAADALPGDNEAIATTRVQ